MTSANRPASAPDVTAVLAELTESITSTLELRQVLQAVTDAGTRLTGAELGAFFYNTVDEHGDAYRLHVITGADPAIFEHMPSPRRTDLFEPTFSGGGTVRLDDITTDRRVAGLPLGHLQLRSYLATPVMARSGEVIGALLFGHSAPGVFSEASERLVRLVATQAAVAVENARLFAAEQQARREAEAAAANLRMLQRVTGALAHAHSMPDVHAALDETLRHPLGAAHVAIYVREQGPLASLMSSEARDQRRASYSRAADIESLFGGTVTGRRPRWVSSRDDFAASFPLLLTQVPDTHAAMAVPFVGGSFDGVLFLSWNHSRSFTQDDVQLGASVADKLTSTMERVSLLQAEARAQDQLRAHVETLTATSQTLQRSLLPGDLPTVPGMDVAVRYLPGTEGAEVGGDWYDLIAGPDGKFTLVVGDVEGHSFSAAAVMGKVSTALRAYLAEGHAVDVALARANPLVEGLDVLVTCFAMTVDPETGTLEMARAGHPQPVFRRDADCFEATVPGGPPLGVPGAVWPVSTGTAIAGDRIVLYTDGLVDIPGTDPDGQVCLITDVVADSHGDVEAAADAVLARVPRSGTDDVALLVAEFHGPQLERAARLRVDSNARVSTARRFTADQLARWNLDGATETATLVVSEMVTNALEHGGGLAMLELRPEPEAVRIAVTDERAAPPVPKDPDVDEVRGRGLLVVEALAAEWGVDPSGDGKTVWARIAADAR